MRSAESDYISVTWDEAHHVREDSSQGSPDDLIAVALKSLANSDRRAIVELLALHDDRAGVSKLSISGVADLLDLTRFSASRHLMILRQAGLVELAKSGTSTLFSLRSETLHALEDWIIGLTPSHE